MHFVLIHICFIDSASYIFFTFPFFNPTLLGFFSPKPEPKPIFFGFGTETETDKNRNRNNFGFSSEPKKMH